MNVQKCYFGPKSFDLPLAAILAVLAFASTLQADLVSYWNFDDGATVTDQIGSNHGTVIHNALFNADTPDTSSNSLDLSATGVGPDQDYVRIGPAADGDGTPPGRDLGIAATNSFSIATWVNYSDSDRGIVTIKQDLTSTGADRSGITLGISSSRVFVGIVPSNGADLVGDFDGDDDVDGADFLGIQRTDPFLIPIWESEYGLGDAVNNIGLNFRDIIARDLRVLKDEWHHIAATYDFASDQVTLYLDGVASADLRTDPGNQGVGADGSNATGGAGIDFVDSNGSFTGFGAAGNAPVHDHSAGDFTRHFYDGLIDDVGLWDHALEASSILLLATGTKPPDIPGPLGLATAEIPEPGSLVLAMFGMAGLVAGLAGRVSRSRSAT